jgi:tetratricopeptide (TPR) repeat protein
MIRLAKHYLSKLKNAEIKYRRGEDIVDSFRQGDWGQIVPLYQWIAKHRASDESLLKLCSDYPVHAPNILNALQTPDERMQWLDIAYEAAQELRRFEERVAHLGNLALTSRNAGRHERIITLFEDLYNLVRGRNDREEANILTLIGECYRTVGRYQEAISVLHRALSIARGRPYILEWVTYHNLGITYRNMGNIEQSIEYHNSERSVSEEANDLAGVSRAYASLGIACYERLEIAKALDYYILALAITERDDFKQSTESTNVYQLQSDTHIAELVQGVATQNWQKFMRLPILGNRGVSELMTGKHEAALRSFQEAILLSEQAGHKRFEAVWLYNKGIVHHALGEYEQAIQHYTTSQDIAKAIQAPRAVAFAKAGLGRTYLALAFLDNDAGNVDLTHLVEAFQFAVEIKNPRDCQDWGASLAEAYLYTDQMDKAHHTVEHILHHDVAENKYRVVMLHGLILAHQSTQKDRAHRAFEDALTLTDDILAKTPELVAVQYNRGFVFAGLAMLSEGKVRSDYLALARSAYTDARHITHARGVINDALRLLDTLQPFDMHHELASVRATLNAHIP